MHVETTCLLNASRKLSDFRRMIVYSKLIPCNMCAGAFAHFGIIGPISVEGKSVR